MINIQKKYMVDMKINKHLKSLIEDLNLTQEEIADKIGMNKIHLNKVLNGKAEVSMDLAKKLSSLPEFNTTPQEVLFPPLEVECIGEIYPSEAVSLYKGVRPKILCKFPISPGYIALKSYLMPRLQATTSPTEVYFDYLIFDGNYINNDKLEKDFDNRFCLVNTMDDKMLCGVTLVNRSDDKICSITQLGASAPVRNVKIKSAAIIKIGTNSSYHGIFNS